MTIKINNSLSILPDSNELKFDQKGQSRVVKIEPKSMRLLKHLILNKGEVCTTDELVQKLWDGNQGVGKPALRKHIYKLKVVLKKFGIENAISSISKNGYRFNVLPDASSNRPMTHKKLWATLAGLVLVAIVIKIIYPGIIHRLLH